MTKAPLAEKTSTLSFADVAHQTLLFDRAVPPEALVLELLDSRWMQRLRSVSQTGNTRLVYMFAEHSRFGHSLGVAYLATLLMRRLKAFSPEQVEPYECAVAAAALLHDVGHVAPGSHLAERIWSTRQRAKHELVGSRIITADPEIRGILERTAPELPNLVCRILENDPELPSWTKEIISGSGWNADRGNWTIVDSTMCAVSYGRYNVTAIVDAFRITNDGKLVLQESRLDALTHFFVARDSMYRQIYQHRALQAADGLTHNLVRRLRAIASPFRYSREALAGELRDRSIFADEPMLSVLLAEDYARELPIEEIYMMTEPWWSYHLLRWCGCDDPILRDLALRLRDRRLFKTIRLPSTDRNEAAIKPATAVKPVTGSAVTEIHERPSAAESMLCEVRDAVLAAGLDPDYYLILVEEADTHRGKAGDIPEILLDSGAVVPVIEVEPLIAQLLTKPASNRRWLAVPKEVKDRLGYAR